MHWRTHVPTRLKVRKIKVDFFDVYVSFRTDPTLAVLEHAGCTHSTTVPQIEKRWTSNIQVALFAMLAIK